MPAAWVWREFSLFRIWLPSAYLKQEARLGPIKVSISSNSSLFDKQQIPDTPVTPLGLTGMGTCDECLFFMALKYTNE